MSIQYGTDMSIQYGTDMSMQYGTDVSIQYGTDMSIQYGTNMKSFEIKFIERLYFAFTNVVSCRLSLCDVMMTGHHFPAALPLWNSHLATLFIQR